MARWAGEFFLFGHVGLGRSGQFLEGGLSEECFSRPRGGLNEFPEAEHCAELVGSVLWERRMSGVHVWTT
eukprot:4496683-Pyramimonas_sp.AAC.1